MKKLTQSAILISLALVLSLVEYYLPLDLLIPVPGVKLGLANIVTMFALFYLSIPSAISIVVLRCFLASLFFGGFTALAYSLTGGLLALFIMWALMPLYDKHLSLIGISVAGAAFHNTGQIIMAVLITGTPGIFVSYYPPLLIISVGTGIITGSIFHLLHQRLLKIPLFSNQ